MGGGPITSPWSTGSCTGRGPVSRGVTCLNATAPGRLYERHRRWSADGTWAKILYALQAGADATAQGTDDSWAVNADSTSCRAHQHASGARHRPPSDHPQKGAAPVRHCLAGAADTIVVLARNRQAKDAVLKVTGRDVLEPSTP